MPPNLEELKRQETASRLSQSDRASRLADTHGPAHLSWPSSLLGPKATKRLFYKSALQPSLLHFFTIQKNIAPNILYFFPIMQEVNSYYKSRLYINTLINCVVIGSAMSSA
jgi:hypothetical protein